MTEHEKVKLNTQEVDSLEWKYAPPPTVYDLVRDSFLLRAGRLPLHTVLRLCIRAYNGITVLGQENVINNWPCIITPNHSSHMDTIAVFNALPISRINRTFPLAAQDYFFSNAATAFFFRLLANVIPIDRTGADKTGLALCVAKQRDGKSIIMFPEGTRSTTGEMRAFKKGAVLLSREIQTPVIPTYLKGTYDSLPKSRFFPRRKRITVVFGSPVRYWQGELADLEPESAAVHLENEVSALKEAEE